ncbi:MAG TPA: tryptophan synthase subunit alpha [Rhizomicrobium sp.]|nr:tryptophan synthase subunit alpha [Rhizomicrobium sp.]
MSRLGSRFAELKASGRKAFVPFISAGDPDLETSFAILEKLPGAGADVIELGMPFSDPMADGPAVQASSLRALKSGASMTRTLEMVKKFRKADGKTPIVLMGYFNPIHAYGTARFIRDAAAAGADGLIVVDLPPEEDEVLRLPARAQGLNIIRLATPTSDAARLVKILDGASGFLYYVSIAGITGTKTFDAGQVRSAVARIRKATSLPIAVGFGVKTPEQAGEIAGIADAVVVGSAIVAHIADKTGAPRAELVASVLELCRSLAASTHGAQSAKVATGFA